MRSLLIQNTTIVQLGGQNIPSRKDAMNDARYLEGAYLLAENGIITAFGTMDNNAPEHADVVLDGTNRLLVPTFCDSHTHLVFGKSREREFEDRLAGLTYQQIAEKGGGILNSARVLAAMPEEQLLEQAYYRAYEVMLTGTGAIEIKSGYGLTTEAELKMLHVAKKLATLVPMTIKTTFLGAHAIPADYKTNRQGYINLICQDMLPKVAEYADFCDVFCETGYFTPEETELILTEAIKYGLKPKVHANQMGLSGGVEVGLKVGATSVDHLEYLTDSQIHALAQTNTVATALPGASFFLRMPYTPMRALVDSGAILALASDYNPGSCPSGNMPFMLTLACLYGGLSPTEAFTASTVNGAYAMQSHTQTGQIAVGYRADIMLIKGETLAALPYAFARNVIETVILNGTIV